MSRRKRQLRKALYGKRLRPLSKIEQDLLSSAVIPEAFDLPSWKCPPLMIFIDADEGMIEAIGSWESSRFREDATIRFLYPSDAETRLPLRPVDDEGHTAEIPEPIPYVFGTTRPLSYRQGGTVTGRWSRASPDQVVRSERIIRNSDMVIGIDRGNPEGDETRIEVHRHEAAFNTDYGDLEDRFMSENYSDMFDHLARQMAQEIDERLITNMTHGAAETFRARTDVPSFVSLDDDALRLDNFSNMTATQQAERTREPTYNESVNELRDRMYELAEQINQSLGMPINRIVEALRSVLDRNDGGVLTREDMMSMIENDVPVMLDPDPILDMYDDEIEQEENELPITNGALDPRNPAVARLLLEHARNLNYVQINFDYNAYDRSYTVNFKLDDTQIMQGLTDRFGYDIIEAASRALENVRQQQANERHMLQSIVKILTDNDDPAALAQFANDTGTTDRLGRLLEQATEVLNGNPLSEPVNPVKADDGRVQAGRRRIRVRSKKSGEVGKNGLDD